MSNENIQRSKPFMDDYLPEVDEVVAAMEAADFGQEIEIETIDEYEDDGQPSEYDEWQDYMGGDAWDHGQYEWDCDLHNEFWYKCVITG